LILTSTCAEAGGEPGEARMSLGRTSEVTEDPKQKTKIQN